MTRIHLVTKVNAPIETVFDLARNIDVHQSTTSKTKEKAIAGTTSGLIQAGETVTWKGKHFGFCLEHKSRITGMVFPENFVDEMEKGHFKSFRHEHVFRRGGEATLMVDDLEYETPYGIFGKWFDNRILKKYLTDFLVARNNAMKNLAEKQHQSKP